MGILSGKTALITGSSRGIGQEIARCFVREGASIVIHGRDEAALKTLAEELRTDESQVEYGVAEAHDKQGMAGLVDITMEKFGKMDILVNNAGVTRDTLLLKMSDADWDEIIAINLNSMFATCRAAYRPMMKQKGGSIINMTSIVGIMGQIGQANYSASKAGIIGFTKSLARELARKKVRVNAIAPGYIDTELTGIVPEVEKQKLLAMIPLGRTGTVQEVAALTRFLASDESQFITGQVLVIDGGMVM